MAWLGRAEQGGSFSLNILLLIILASLRESIFLQKRCVKYAQYTEYNGERITIECLNPRGKVPKAQRKQMQVEIYRK